MREKLLENYRKSTGYKGEFTNISEVKEIEGMILIEFNIENKDELQCSGIRKESFNERKNI